MGHRDRGISSATVAQVAVVCRVVRRGWTLARDNREKQVILFSPAPNTRLYPASKYGFNWANLYISTLWLSEDILKQLLGCGGRRGS